MYSHEHKDTQESWHVCPLGTGFHFTDLFWVCLLETLYKIGLLGQNALWPMVGTYHALQNETIACYRERKSTHRFVHSIAITTLLERLAMVKEQGQILAT